jgi:hypothetical protein
MTLEQLTALVGILQTEISSLKQEVKQYRQDILELENQLSRSVTTQKLVVQNDAQIVGRNVLTDGQMLDAHEGRLNTHDGTLNTHEGRLNTHDGTLNTHEGRLNAFSQSISIPGDIQFGATLMTPGRMHITGPEGLYLLHKTGVIVGKHWGGTGDLVVEGNLVVAGKATFKFG